MKEETGVLEKTLRSTEIQLTYNDRRGDASDDHNFSVPSPPPVKKKETHNTGYSQTVACSSHGWKPEVYVLQARTMVSFRFPNYE